MDERIVGHLPFARLDRCKNFIERTGDVPCFFRNRRVGKIFFQLLKPRLSDAVVQEDIQELEQNRVWGKSSTHRQLMAAMQTSLKTIHSEKEKLEGIGLLKTYIKETEHERLFIYELIPPLRPDGPVLLQEQTGGKNILSAAETSPFRRGCTRRHSACRPERTRPV